MALVPEIDRLLDIDAENVREIRRFLSEVAPESLEVLNQAAVHFKTAARAFADGLGEHWSEPAAKAAAAGFEDSDRIFSMPDLPPVPGKEAEHADAVAALHSFLSRENRGMLLARVGVLYATSVADLMRMRVTAPLGYIRIQCETLAVMKLMLDKPAIAREWRLIETHEEGRAFMNAHQQEVKQVLRDWNLAWAYDNASSTALHCRFAGTALGLRVNSSCDGSRITQNIEVVAQEIQPDNPDLFLLTIFHCLRVQERILSRLHEACPEITDALFIETRVPMFARSVDRLFETLARRRPDLAGRYQEEEAV